MTVIDGWHDSTRPADLDAAVNEYTTSKATKQDKIDLVAYLVYWLVHEGPRELDRVAAEQTKLFENWKKAFEGVVGCSTLLPDWDSNQELIRPVWNDGIFEHFNDKSPKKERYLRAYTCLRTPFYVGTREAKDEKKILKDILRGVDSQLAGVSTDTGSSPTSSSR
jgi:hypothetical protein